MCHHIHVSKSLPLIPRMRAAENLGTNASTTERRRRRAMMHFMVALRMGFKKLFEKLLKFDNPKRAETMGKVFQVIFHETS